MILIELIRKRTHLKDCANIAERWENLFKAMYKQDTVSAISAQLSGFAATMSTSTCRSSFMLAVCSSAQYLFRKVHRRFERRSSSYVYHSPLMRSPNKVNSCCSILVTTVDEESIPLLKKWPLELFYYCVTRYDS